MSVILNVGDVEAVLRLVDHFTPTVTAMGVTLDSFGTRTKQQTNKIVEDFRKMTSAFSGDVIAAQAAVMISAVEKVGGTARLTTAEMKQYNAVMDEAVNKQRALGVALSPELQSHAAAMDAAAAARAREKQLAEGYAMAKAMDKEVAAARIANAKSTEAAWTSQHNVLESQLQSASRAFSNHIDQLQKTATMYRTLGRDMTQVGQSLTMFVTLPLVAVGVGAVKAAADFETSMVKLITLSNVTEGNMNRMREAVLKMAPAVGIGPGKLAEALLQVTSTGIRGMEAMEILRQSAMGSAIGLGDVTEVAKTVTSAIAAYGAENMSASKAANILYKMVVEGKGELDQFAGSMGRVVGMAATVGVSMADAASFIATFTRTGGSASEAVTALRGVLQRLEIKETANTRKAFKEMGQDFDEFRQLIATKGLTPALVDLMNKFGATNEQLGKIFPNLRALNGVMTVAGAQAKSASEIFKHITNDANEMEIAFGRAGDTIAFKWGQVKAAFEAIAIVLGDKLRPQILKILPMLEQIGRDLAGWVEWFGKLTPGMQEFILKTLGLVALAGPLLMFLGGIARGLSLLYDVAVLLKNAQLAATMTRMLTATGLFSEFVAGATFASTLATLGLFAAALWGVAQAGQAASLWWDISISQPNQAAADAATQRARNQANLSMAVGIASQWGIPTQDAVMKQDYAWAEEILRLYAEALRESTKTEVVATEAKRQLKAAQEEANKAFESAVKSLVDRLQGDTGPSVKVVSEAFSRLTKEEQNSVTAIQVLIPIIEKWGKTTDAIPPKLQAWYDLNAGLTTQGQAFWEAFDNLISLGKTWQETIGGIDSALVGTITGYLRAGASMSTLTAAFVTAQRLLTKEQLDAIKQRFDAMNKDAAATGRLEEEIARNNAALEGDRLSIRLARLAAERDADIKAAEEQVRQGKQTTDNLGLIWDRYWSAKGAAEKKNAEEVLAIQTRLETEYSKMMALTTKDQIALIDEELQAEQRAFLLKYEWDDRVMDMMERIAERRKEILREEKRLRDSVDLNLIKGLGAAAGSLNAPFAESFNQALSSISVLINSTSTEVQKTQALRDMWAAVGAAISEAASLLADGDKTSKWNVLGSVAEGASAGGQAGGMWGAIAGSIIGNIQGIIEMNDAIEAVEKSIKDLQNTLIDLYGSLEAAEDAAEAFGIAMDTAAGNSAEGLAALQQAAQELNDAMDLLKSAMEEYNITVVDLSGPVQALLVSQDMQKVVDQFNALIAAGASYNRVILAMKDSINAMIIEVMATGQQMSLEFARMVQQLIQAGGISNQAAAALLGLTSTLAASWEDVADAMARYGLEAEQLGSVIMQMQLDAKMQQLAADWSLLSGISGVNMSNLAMGMQPQLQAIINTALANGLAIDESLRPLVDLLIQMGLLTNLTGGVLDASQLTWQQSITDTDRLLTKMDQIIAAIYIASGVPGYQNPSTPLPPTPPNQGNNNNQHTPPDWMTQNTYASGTGGILNFGSGTPAILHGFEGVFTDAQMRSITTSAAQFGANSRMSSLIAAQDSRMSGSSQPVNIHIHAWDGDSVNNWLWNGGARQLTTAIVPEIPNEAWRLGLG